LITELIHILSWLGFLSVSPPTSASTGITINWVKILIVIAEAIGVNLLYAVGRLKLTDVDKMRRYTFEMRAFQSEMRAAMREGDKQKQEKMKRKQQQMTKMQMEMQKEQFKPTILFALPLFGVYYVINGWMNCNNLFAFFSCTKQLPLIATPIYVPYIFAGLNVVTTAGTVAMALAPFWVWYFVCSFTFSTLINRLFGLTFDY
jgi:uncharacterized membrane protein (DUF106 family)